MNNKKVFELFASKEWHFAKTMPEIPHFYARKKEWGNDEEFKEVVEYIRKYGVAEKFYSKTFIYFYLHGWKYWTMNEPAHETQIINRARP